MQSQCTKHSASNRGTPLPLFREHQIKNIGRWYDVLDIFSFIIDEIYTNVRDFFFVDIIYYAYGGRSFFLSRLSPFVLEGDSSEGDT